MKINEKVIEIQGNMDFDKSTRMTFDDTSIAHIIQSLTNMYSDPYAAIAREYAGNAYDSHIMAFQKKPIEITTPTDLNSSFIVRDFGTGMSREELIGIYSKYGASTKRNTNDQIGAFGLGAKSALALVSSFTVLSVKDGKKNTVIVSKDETGVGALNFFEEQDTDAENGVTVTIPVPKPELMRNAVKGLFLGWPEGMVKVDGVLIEKTVNNPKFFTAINEAGYLAVSKKVDPSARYRSYDYSTTVKALVGPVSYDIEKKLLIDILKEAGIDVHKNSSKIQFDALPNLVFRLPNGSVDLTPSRETLIFNVRTKASIVKAYKDMELGITHYLNEKLTKAKNRKEALTLSINFIAQGFMVPTTWNGENIPLKGSTIAKEEDKEKVIVTQSRVVAKSPSGHKKIVPNVQQPVTSIHFVPFAKPEIPTILPSEPYDGISKRIIITEAVLPESSGDKDYHTVAASLSAYLKVAEPNHGNNAVQFFSTSLKESELNPWAIATADQILTAEEVMEIVRKKRREDSAVRKLNKIATATAAAPVEVKISIAVRVKANGTSKSGTYKIQTAYLSEMPDDAKYVVIKATSKKQRTFKTLEEALYNYLRGWNSYGTYNATPYTEEFLASLAKLITSAGYTLVAVPDSRSNIKLLESLTNKVEFEGLAQKIILETLASLTEVEKEWIAGIKLHRNHYKWITASFKSDYSGIESEETRQWIKLATNNRGRVLNSLFGLAFGAISHHAKLESNWQKQQFENSVKTSTRLVQAKWGKDTEISNKLIELVTSPVETETRQYPLLHDIYSCNNTAAIVEYINFKDAVAKA